MRFDLNNFKTKILCEDGCTDAVVETVARDNMLDVYVRATEDKLTYVELQWDFASDKDLYVLGDVWERSYGELSFKKLCDQDRPMPWYFMATDGKQCFGFGVKTQPNAFICFHYTAEGIKAVADCRNGGCGVELGGRRLHIGTFVYKEYASGDVYDCLHDYCKTLCDHPLLTKERVYGGNNWYYAYGKSSYEEIIADTKFQTELAKGIDNKPFEVIDDCWQLNTCQGPWLPNEKFGDMKKLADDIRKEGARPGLWIRLLYTDDPVVTEEMMILRDGKRLYLDPTHPEAQAYIRADVERVRDWGFELLKHDYTTVDLFGHYGMDLDETITKIDGWHFYDRTKTNAEIVLDLYRLILEAAGDMYIIGCNTVSHLCAGLVHINRIGDDTSGREWERTKKMGINTLAFRLAQNEAFYMCDADCVGILEDFIPWEKNGQWLHLLSCSNTPLFVSCNDQVKAEVKKDLTDAYRRYQEVHTFKPLDIYDNLTPSRWEIDGEIVEYNW